MVTTTFGITLPGILQVFNSPPNMGALAIVFSLIIVPLVSVLTPKLPKKDVEDAFACYDEKIVTEHKFALDEVTE